MDILDDVCSFMITLIYIYLFTQYFNTERRLMKIYGKGIRDNPMLRYKTQNGPITSPMGLIGLTHAQSFIPKPNYAVTATSTRYSTYDSPTSRQSSKVSSYEGSFRSQNARMFEEEQRRIDQEEQEN